MSTTTSTRTNMTNYMAALQAGDMAALTATFQPDATWWLPGDLPISRTWQGRDAILGEFLPTVMDRFAPGSVRFTTHSVAADGDAAFVEWTVEATTVDGQAYKNDYMAIFEHRDGRIATVREYMDTGVMARLLFPRGS